MSSTSTSASDSSTAPGRPRCSNCGHDLTGAIKSSTCPECGKPLVEVLVRDESKILKMMGKRYTSKARLLGMPVICVSLGMGPDGKMGRAKGWIAIGDRAYGMIALGGFSCGVVAMGGFSVGVVTLGGMSLGLLGGCGGLALSPLGLAIGGCAIGAIATGGFAIGIVTISGMGAGWYAWAGPAATKAAHFYQGAGAPGSDAEATAVFDSLGWLLGKTISAAPLHAAAWFLTLYGTLAVLLGLPAVIMWQRREEKAERDERDDGAPPTSRPMR